MHQSERETEIDREGDKTKFKKIHGSILRNNLFTELESYF